MLDATNGEQYKPRTGTKVGLVQMLRLVQTLDWYKRWTETNVEWVHL